MFILDSAKHPGNKVVIKDTTDIIDEKLANELANSLNKIQDDELSEYRRQINEIDSEIVKSLRKRFHAAQKIAEIKAKSKEPDKVYDETREDEILNRMVEEFCLDAGVAYLYKNIFREIMKASREYQYKNIIRILDQDKQWLKYQADRILDTKS